MDELQFQQMQKEIETLKKTVARLEASLRETDNYVKAPRVQIKNFEGLFKTLTTAPTTGFPDGALVFTDIAGTRKINVLINKVWYSVTVT